MALMMAAGLLLSLGLHLMPALLAGLLVVQLVHLLAPRFVIGRLDHAWAKVLVVSLITLVVLGALGGLVAGAILYLRTEGGLAGRQVVGGRRKLGVLDRHQPVECGRRAVAVGADVLAGRHAGEPALTELVHGEVVQVGRRVRGVDRLEVVGGHVAGDAVVDQADAGIAAPAGDQGPTPGRADG